MCQKLYNVSVHVYLPCSLTLRSRKFLFIPKFKETYNTYNFHHPLCFNVSAQFYVCVVGGGEILKLKV